MAFKVEFSAAAAEDLEQLFDFALQRELNSETGDLDIPDRALQAIKDGMAFLQTSLPSSLVPFGINGKTITTDH